MNSFYAFQSRWRLTHPPRSWKLVFNFNNIIPKNSIPHLLFPEDLLFLLIILKKSFLFPTVANLFFLYSFCNRLLLRLHTHFTTEKKNITERKNLMYIIIEFHHCLIMLISLSRIYFNQIAFVMHMLHFYRHLLAIFVFILDHMRRSLGKFFLPALLKYKMNCVQRLTIGFIGVRDSQF